MIATLTGILKLRVQRKFSLRVHGIGYTISIPLSTYEKLGDLGSSVSLLTHFHVREDAMLLFGFSTEEERRLFKLLISVSGIGPKIAQSTLSGMNVEELKSHIVGGTSMHLWLFQESAEKPPSVSSWNCVTKPVKPRGIRTDFCHRNGNRRDANRSASGTYITWYNQQIAEKAIRLVVKEAEGSTISLEELIKRALRHTNVR